MLLVQIIQLYHPGHDWQTPIRSAHLISQSSYGRHFNDNLSMYYSNDGWGHGAWSKIYRNKMSNLVPLKVFIMKTYLRIIIYSMNNYIVTKVI